MSKRGGHGHHGGAWKVAYADFVTAMMALFIVLWILAGDAKSKAAVAAYFRHPSVIMGKDSGFLSNEGVIDFQASLARLTAMEAENARLANGEAEDVEEGASSSRPEDSALLSESAEELEGLLNSSSTLRELKAQVSIEFTSMGMRIQIQDLQRRPLFQLGSAHPNAVATELLRGIARILAPLPNLVLVEGHTDSTPYSERTDYGNWELSGDRANAARRVLEGGGIQPGRIARVVGYADRRPLADSDPSDEHNRRISITVCYNDVRLE